VTQFIWFFGDIAIIILSLSCLICIFICYVYLSRVREHTKDLTLTIDHWLLLTTDKRTNLAALYHSTSPHPHTHTYARKMTKTCICWSIRMVLSLSLATSHPLRSKSLSLPKTKKFWSLVDSKHWHSQSRAVIGRGFVGHNHHGWWRLMMWCDNLATTNSTKSHHIENAQLCGARIAC